MLNCLTFLLFDILETLSTQTLFVVSFVGGTQFHVCVPSKMEKLKNMTLVFFFFFFFFWYNEFLILLSLSVMWSLKYNFCYATIMLNLWFHSQA